MENSTPSVLIVGTESDNPFAIDVGIYCKQDTDIADLLALKTFANSEFCPRFISSEKDLNNIGYKLKDTTVVVVSTGSNAHSRNELAWRNLLVTRAAKDNGAEKVILVEPDLFFSAQDRGPREDHGQMDRERDVYDYKKFDGQPFTGHLYAELLKLSGIDAVITVHNHSVSVQALFKQQMHDGFLNLCPSEVFADYIRTSDVAPNLQHGNGLLVCAPDQGARAFANRLFTKLHGSKADLLYLAKQRKGERNVSSLVDQDSPSSVEAIEGKDVIIVDDMVRTGGTVKETCRVLKAAGAGRIIFFVTHFYASPEVRENLNEPALDEIITTNTIPSILNRDTQGRLRRKMTVLKIEKWISRSILEFLGMSTRHLYSPLYTVDMSSKNPRWSLTTPH